MLIRKHERNGKQAESQIWFLSLSLPLSLSFLAFLTPFVDDFHRQFKDKKSRTRRERTTSTEVQQWLIWHCRQPIMMTVMTKWIETSSMTTMTTTSRERMMISRCVVVSTWRKRNYHNTNLIRRWASKMTVSMSGCVHLYWWRVSLISNTCYNQMLKCLTVKKDDMVLIMSISMMKTVSLISIFWSFLVKLQRIEVNTIRSHACIWSSHHRL